jgi:hypothetical protein
MPSNMTLVAIAVPVLTILIFATQHFLNTRETEKTRREVAAYLAEGTIDRDDAAMLLGKKIKAKT